MLITEIFESIQGEGRYSGTPTLFIRLSGCTRKCIFCDTKYHAKSKKIKSEELVKIIKKSKFKNICWTGGEPLIQKLDLYKIILKTKEKFHTIETNGDLLENNDFRYFNNITCSPKDLKLAKKIYILKRKFKFDIKIISDGKKLNQKILKFADYIMPLTTKNKSINNYIERNVWKYCVSHNKNFSPRLHHLIFGNKKGI